MDSEAPVTAGKAICAHSRDQDGWTNVMPDEQVHLRVQCMEAWFLADRAALEEYYGHEFSASGLPGNPSTERIPKKDVLDGLKEASRITSKRAVQEDQAWV